jgi:fucose permease
MAAAPDWLAFLAATVPMSLGIGALDGGINGLVLDAFRERRGRALNSLHVFFSAGALGAPLVTGRLVEAGTAWESVLVGTAIAAIPVAAVFALIPMPHGRRRERASATDHAPQAEPADLARLGLPIVLLALAIGAYVAAQGGISNWLVRFLEPAPLETATTTLSLLWTGLTVGRIASIFLADRFDHTRFATVAFAAMALLMLAAILVPVLPVQMALFGLAGVASAPIFPMIMAIGGERYPDRSGAVGGLLATAAQVGTIVYPPAMGFVSVAFGLLPAMIVAALLLWIGVLALVAVGRQPAPGGRTLEGRLSEPAR